MPTLSPRVRRRISRPRISPVMLAGGAMVLMVVLRMVMNMPAFGGRTPDETLPSGDVVPGFLVEMIDRLGPNEKFTAFAPDPAAMADLSKRIREEHPPADAEELISEVVLHHLISGRRLESKVIPRKDEISIQAASGYKLEIRRRGPHYLMVSGINTIKGDVMYRRGVIFYLEGVLLPPSVSEEGSLQANPGLNDNEDAVAGGRGGEEEGKGEEESAAAEGGSGDGEEGDEGEAGDAGEGEEENGGAAGGGGVEEGGGKDEEDGEGAAAGEGSDGEEGEEEDTGGGEEDTEVDAEESGGGGDPDGGDEDEEIGGGGGGGARAGGADDVAELGEKEVERMEREEERMVRQQHRKGHDSKAQKLREKKERERKELERVRNELKQKVESEEESKALEGLQALLASKEKEREKERAVKEDDEDTTTPPADEGEEEAGEEGEGEDGGEGEEEGEEKKKRKAKGGGGGEAKGEGEEGEEGASGGEGVEGEDAEGGLTDGMKPAEAKESFETFGRKRPPPPCNGRGVMRGEDGEEPRCHCSVLFDGTNCENSRPHASIPKLKGFNESIVFSQERLSRDARALSLGLDIVSLHIDTPDESFVLVPEMSPHLYSVLWPNLPEVDLMEERHYQTCALVGNSGVLMRSELGEEIDDHDMVMRFNRGVTKGFEPQVGSKTTLKVLTPEYTGFREPMDATEVMLYLATSSQHLERLLSFKKKVSVETSHFFSPDFLSAASKFVGQLPSTGMTGLYLAMHICEKVDLYGFFSSERQGTRFHYYDRMIAPQEQIVLAAKEYRLTSLLEKEGRVEIRDPCASECQQSLAKCSSCLHVAVPNLFRFQELTAEQRSAIEEQERWWKAYGAWEREKGPRRPERKSSHKGVTKAEMKKHIHGDVSNEEQITGLNLGWEYLIESGSLEDLPESQINQYFKDFNLAIPGTLLEKLEMVKRHYRESREAWERQDEVSFIKKNMPFTNEHLVDA